VLHCENSQPVTYPYRAYGLTLGSDTPVSALRPEPSEHDRYDIVVSLGPETDWVRKPGVYRLAWSTRGPEN